MEIHGAFNDLDYIVIGIILLSGLLALMRGFLREVFSLISWVGAYLAAVRFYPLAVPTMHHYIKNDNAAKWAAMAGVFVAVLIVLMIIGSLICSTIKGRALTAIDRSLGFLYGVARGILVVSLVYLVMVTAIWPEIDMPQQPVPPPQGDTVQQPQDKDRNAPPDLLVEAKTRPAMAYFAKTLKVLIPKDMLDKALKGAEEEKESAEKASQQKMLDTLSTPAPAGNNAPLDVTRTANPGTAP